MAGAHPRIVGDVGIARLHGLEREVADEMLHRLRHRVDVARRAGHRLRQHAALAVEHAGREVAALAHDRRERRAHQHLRLLLDHRDQAVPHDLQVDQDVVAVCSWCATGSNTSPCRGRRRAMRAGWGSSFDRDCRIARSAFGAPTLPFQGDGDATKTRYARMGSTLRPPLHHDAAGGVDARVEACGDECRGLVLGDDRRPGNAHARLHALATVERHVDGLARAAVEEGAAAVRRRRRAAPPPANAPPAAARPSRPAPTSSAPRSPHPGSGGGTARNIPARRSRAAPSRRRRSGRAPAAAP